ncbi:MAG: zf-HC2 domain-containing protein [Planctomycetes bacterium]|nr:zf-HC2 domain-containing protein [Planctomycetota bacterium]
MNCPEVQHQLGLYLDQELPADLRPAFQEHLDQCSACRANLEAMKVTAGAVASLPEPRLPSELWNRIERQLDTNRIAGGIQPEDWFRIPPRVAASVILFIGLGLIGYTLSNGGASPASAATVDFSVLLDALPLDAEKAFRKFLMLYDAKESSPFEARRYAPGLTFELPEELPGGFRLRSVYLLRFGDGRGVAAAYVRDGDFLAAIYHPPVQQESFGTHKDYPCVVGQHHGHKVQVSEWSLIHLTDPTTCHCILSRLDEETELPAVLAAIVPHATTGHTHDAHH